MYNILLIGGLTDDKFISKTKALIDNSKIANVYIFRNEGIIYENDKKVKFLRLSKLFYGKKSTLKRIFHDTYNFIGFFSLLILKRIDLIVGLYLYPHGYYASILGKIFNKPVILILPGTDLKTLLESKKHLELFRNTKYLGLRGSNSVKQLIDFGFSQDQLFILPNVLNFNQFTYYFEKNEKKYDIVFTGYLRELKKVENILQIIKLLKSYFPNIKCLITGDGPEKNKLILQSKHLGLSENIDFKPYTKPIESALVLGKIYLLTSISEGLPMSVIEAMGCGLPVIVSNINDIPDVVEHGVTGFLVEPTDINSFVQYCKQLIEDANLRIMMGKAARTKIEWLCRSEYSYKTIYNLWDKILTNSLKHYSN